MLKTTVILFVIYFTAINGYERKGYPGYVYHEELGGWFKLHDKPANYQTADETCIKEGAILPTSRFNELDDTFIKIVKDSKKDIKNLYISSLFESAPTKPNDAENEVVIYETKPTKIDCMVFFVNDASKNSVNCSEEHPFVCFAPMEEADCDVHEWGQDREGYPGYNRCSKVTGWVKVHPGPADFDEAKETCEKEGAKLIDPNDPIFKEVALKLMKENSTDENPLLIFGKVKIVHPRGGLVKIDGKTKFVSKLKPFCSLMYPNGTIDKYVDCDKKLGFICYAPYTNVYSCGDGDYQVDESTERCFKINSVGKTWNESRQQCQSEGGDLAVLKSTEDAKILTDMFEKYNKYFETYHPTHLFVGVSLDSEGSWKTINDETIEKAGYDTWAAGKPANLQSDDPPVVKGVSQSCAGVNMLGQFVDCWCELKHGYICEKKATVTRRSHSPIPAYGPLHGPLQAIGLLAANGPLHGPLHANGPSPAFSSIRAQLHLRRGEQFNP